MNDYNKDLLKLHIILKNKAIKCIRTASVYIVNTVSLFKLELLYQLHNIIFYKVRGEVMMKIIIKYMYQKTSSIGQV